MARTDGHCVNSRNPEKHSVNAGIRKNNAGFSFIRSCIVPFRHSVDVLNLGFPEAV
jgi:hypothetical protein